MGKVRNITEQLKIAAENLKQQVPPGAEPPHMETGQIPPERLPEREEAKQKQLKDIAEKGTGSDDDLDALIRAFLPDDDPLVNP